MTKTAERGPEGVDWSVTTFAGARREQLRRWAQLPLEDIVRSLEEMDDLARLLHSTARPAPGGSGQ